MKKACFGLLVLLGWLCLVASTPAYAAKPVVAIVGFQSRVSDTNVNIEQDEMLGIPVGVLYTELNDPAFPFEVKDFSDATTQHRMEEIRLFNDLGNGRIDPALQKKADFLIYGYLTNISSIKAQSGALGLKGKDKTVDLELSMRVVDAHTGRVVFIATADSRRKSELKYNAILTRNDSGEDDAVQKALSIAATNLAAKFKKAA